MPIFQLQCTKFNFGWGSAPDPAGELTALPDPLAGGNGAHCPLPKNPTRSWPFGPRSWLCSSENFFFKSPDKKGLTVERNLRITATGVVYTPYTVTYGDLIIWVNVLIRITRISLLVSTYRPTSKISRV